jgi:chromosome segregation ATPase
VTLLSGIKNLITRRKPPLAIDIAEPQAEGTVEEVDVSEPVEVVEEVEAMEAVELGVEPDLVNGPGSATEAHGVHVAAVVESIGDRIDAQSDRIETQSSEVRRLVQHMEQLPLVLKQTAEIRGQCAQVIDLVSGQVSEARTREETVLEAVSETRRHEDAVMEAINEAKGHNDAVMEAIKQASSRDDAVIEAVNAAVDKAVSASVKRITEASTRDAETLSRIQRQVESNAQALRMAGETEEGASQNIREVLESSMKVQQAVTVFEKSYQGREAEIAAHFASSKRTMMMLAFACTLASLLALVVAVIAVVM